MVFWTKPDTMPEVANTSLTYPTLDHSPFSLGGMAALALKNACEVGLLRRDGVPRLEEGNTRADSRVQSLIDDNHAP
eukprot:550557-Lingulodinium_polyedra.AAC.1